MPATRTLPVFPLGTVLFPFGALPIHVFEERYRVLVQRCLDGEPEFGVVLIERGSEVGGGDVRFDVGTIARIVECGRFPDGRCLLATAGTDRFQVIRWLPDAPHPVAEVELLGEPAAGPGDDERRETVLRSLRRLLTLASELGAEVHVDVSLDGDPARAAFEACALAPIGPMDRQRLLECTNAAHRLDVLGEVLEEQSALFTAQLGDSST